MYELPYILETDMSTEEKKVDKKTFMEFTLEDMQESLRVSRSCLDNFRYGKRCYWGLRSNIERVMNLHVSIDVANKLFRIMTTQIAIAADYNALRDKAVATLANFDTLPDVEKKQLYHDFSKLEGYSPAIRDLFSEFFIIKEDGEWECKISRGDILDRYFTTKTDPKAPKFTINRLRGLLRFIVQVQNNLMFVYPKELKAIRRHQLTNGKIIIPPVTKLLDTLPPHQIATIFVADGTNFDIYIHDTLASKHVWTSELSLSGKINGSLIRAFNISPKTRRGWSFEERFDCHEILRMLPKPPTPKTSKVISHRLKAKKALTPDEVEVQLREAFARLDGN